MQHELDMSFNYEPVLYKDIRDGKGREPTPKVLEVINNIKGKEKDLVAAWNRVHNPGKPEKRMWFNNIVTYDDDVMQTVAGDHGSLWDYTHKTQVSNKSIANASTFPQDYNFCGQSVAYICGMSVPPLMIKRVVDKLLKQGVFDVK